MKIKPMLLAGVLAATTAASLGAAQLSPSQALQRALGKTSGVRTPDASAEMKLVSTGTSGNINTYYLFSTESRAEFCVVAADDCVEQPLLAYGPRSITGSSAIPPAMQWMLDYYSAEIAQLAAGDVVTRTVTATATDYHDVAPIMTTTWDQGSPYNMLCPTINYSRAYVGCVATAMSQVMRVHRWPERGQGTNTYSCQNVSGAITVNFAEQTYDWDNMPDAITSSSPLAQREAVAQLCYNAGVAVDMMYGLDQSGSYSEFVGERLYKYFNYDKAMRYEERDYYYLTEWIDLLYTELAAGRPIIFSGITKDKAGHSFVIDGYAADGDYFHVNWGWSGLSDGYFKISALNPSQQGIGGSDSGFNYSQGALVGVQPPVEGSEVYPMIVAAHPFTIGSRTYKRTQSSATALFFTGSSYATIVNFAVEPLRFMAGLQLTDENGNVSYIGSTLGERLYAVITGINRMSVLLSSFPEEGTYTVRPAFRYKDKWYPMRQKLNSTYTAWKLTATPSELSFEPIAEQEAPVVGEINVPEEVYANSINRVEVEISAQGTPIYAPLTVTLDAASGSRTYATLLSSILDVAAGETASISGGEFIGTPTGLADGTACKIRVNTTIGGQNVVLAEEEVVYHTNNVKFEIANIKFGSSSRPGTSQLAPAEFPINEFSATVTLKGVEGRLCDNIFGVFINNYGSVVGVLGGNEVTVEAGETADVTISGSTESFLTKNKVFRFSPYSYNFTSVSDIRFVRATTSGLEDLGADAPGELRVSVEDRTVNVTAAATIASVTLYDATGRASMSVAGDGSDSITLDASGLMSGVYVASVVTADGMRYARSIAL